MYTEVALYTYTKTFYPRKTNPEAMSEVVSFRPSADEAQLLERTRRAAGLRSRAEALRFLLRRALERSGPLSEDPVFRLRIPGLRRGRRGLSSGEIDKELYGGSA